MKRTKKYLQAQKRIRELGLRPGKRRENAQLYQLLENNKQVWDHKVGEWTDRTQPRSIFGDDEPTGVVKIRVMAHPNDVQKAVRYLQGTNFKIVEISDEYPNRKGIGVRVYVTATI